MASLTFVGVLAFVFALLVRDRLKRRRRARLWRAQPARSPETAVRVSRYHEVDEHLRRARCTCGGALALLSEGTRSSDAGAVRVTHLSCTVCEAEHDLFFDVSLLLH